MLNREEKFQEQNEHWLLEARNIREPDQAQDLGRENDGWPVV